MTGPVASVMVKKMGCRLTQLIAGFSIICGVGLSALTQEPWHAYVLFSILTSELLITLTDRQHNKKKKQKNTKPKKFKNKNLYNY